MRRVYSSSSTNNKIFVKFQDWNFYFKHKLGTNLLNLRYVAVLPTSGSKTSDSKLKIKEGFESVIQILTGGGQFK